MIISAPGDFRAAARRRLPRFLFDYIDGGAGEERTLRRNSEDLAAIGLRQKVLSGVSAPQLATSLFGRTQTLPVVLAPVGLTGMFARRGEVQAARAAKAKGIPYCLSTVSVCGVEEVSAAAAPIWYQLYMIRDRGFMRELLGRVKAAGCTVLVFTVDLPLPGVRYRDGHSGMSGPRSSLRRYLQALSHPRWAWDVALRGRPLNLGNIASVLRPGGGLPDYKEWLAANLDPVLQWRDIAWIRAHWDGALIVKGILEAEDARAAAAEGVEGIVVSNHGGRQLDGAPSTAWALPAIAEAVGDRLTVLADSGVRSGADVVRLLALGARAVLIGRCWVYALAARGQAGVTQLLDLLESEIRTTMILTGSAQLSALGRNTVILPPK
jgi:L-lactate dehydrogenase (cytochrome)